MVVTASGGAGEPLVHNLPAGRDGIAQGQVLQVTARLRRLHFEHGRKAGALPEGGRVHGCAGGICVFHLQGQAVGGRLPGFAGGGGQGNVHRAVAVVAQDAVGQRGFHVCGGYFPVQAPVGQGGKGGLLRGKRVFRHPGHGEGFGHVAAEHQRLHGGIAVTLRPAIGEVVRRIFREFARGSFQNGGGGGALAAEGIGAGQQPPGLGTQFTGLPQAVHAGKRCLPGHGQAVEPEGFVGLGEKGTAGHAVGL